MQCVLCYVDTAVCQLEDPHVGSYCRSCRHACIVSTWMRHCGSPLYRGAAIRAESPIVSADTHPLPCCRYHDTIVSIDSQPLGRPVPPPTYSTHLYDNFLIPNFLPLSFHGAFFMILADNSVQLQSN